ncbi:MAG: UDP-3-O-(3-hydroxymyristoyl)glucosamine N-acyltransferase [Puniceicoccaceae bacterium]
MQLHLTTEECLKIAGEGISSGIFKGTVGGIATLREAKEGDLSFLGNDRYRSEVAGSRASVIFLPLDFEGEPATGQIYYRVSNPSLALARICAAIERKTGHRTEPGVHPTAFIDRDASVHEEAMVGPFCHIGSGAQVGRGAVLSSHVYLGENSKVGADSVLMPRVTVAEHCEIGERVRLHAGVVIGSDGFGYEQNGERLEKIPQIGNVVVGNDVEIGANSTIDRARFSSTRIGDGTKIDNLVQIGHNVLIGRNCVIVAQVGISGSTVIEDHVVVGGKTGIAGHLRIGANSRIGGFSGVSKDLAPGSFVRGIPATDYHLAQRLAALQRRLPEFFERLASVEKAMASMRERIEV